MHRRLIYVFLALAAVVHVVAADKLTEQQSFLRSTDYHNQLFVLPSSIIKIVALDYKGVVSDYLFMEGMVYIGGLVSQTGNGTGRLELSEHQRRQFYNLLDVSTDLDPYFQDPYHIANAFLTWDVGMVREANALLDKGIHYRHWDWSLPFFCGFNYFYFLQDNDKAAQYLMEASRRPGVSPTIASLASKLAFKANKIENSIIFLTEIISTTEDESLKRIFEMRLEAFKGIYVIDKAVDTYRRQFGRVPANIKELLKRKILAEIPREPYGGNFYIDSHGAARTTSEEQLMPHLKKK